jgi:hypothetical protein
VDAAGAGQGWEVSPVQWDLGPAGVAVLAVMALGFGAVAQLFVRHVTRWLWLIAAAGYFVGSLLVSEVWFGWATEAELQPNIDGLSLDEVLVFGLVPGVLTVLATRYVARRTQRGAPGDDVRDSTEVGSPMR